MASTAADDKGKAAAAPDTDDEIVEIPVGGVKRPADEASTTDKKSKKKKKPKKKKDEVDGEGEASTSKGHTGT